MRNIFLSLFEIKMNNSFCISDINDKYFKKGKFHRKTKISEFNKYKKYKLSSRASESLTIVHYALGSVEKYEDTIYHNCILLKEDIESYIQTEKTNKTRLIYFTDTKRLSDFYY